MTSALDLLMDSDSTAETTTLLESNGICTIDTRTRTIFVPPEIVVGAVQSDKNAERIKFSCPKIVGDNLDLSKFSIRINFENVSSVDPDISIKDQYICEDASINEDNITFSWVIGKNAARYMGTIRFIVCAVKTDSDSNISIEWNTTVAQIPVLEGIEIDQPSLDENNKDVINQLLAITKTASDEAVKNVNSAKEQAITDIQKVSQPDKTLTVEGGIADAKATGNAISSLREDSNAIKNKGITPERTSFFADIECLSERFISFTKKFYPDTNGRIIADNTSGVENTTCTMICSVDANKDYYFVGNMNRWIIVENETSNFEINKTYNILSTSKFEDNTLKIHTSSNAKYICFYFKFDWNYFESNLIEDIKKHTLKMFPYELSNADRFNTIKVENLPYKTIYGKKILFMGDSITQLGMSERGWVKYFCEKIKPSLVVNTAVIGCKWADNDGTIYNGNPTTEDSVNNVMGNQIEKILRGKDTTHPNYSKVDEYSDFDIIIIACGTNDVISIDSNLIEYVNSEFIDVNDVKPLADVNRKKWNGIMRYAYEKLRGMYPNSVIFFCSPIQASAYIRDYRNIRDKGKYMDAICQVISDVNFIDTERCGISELFELNGANGRDLIDGLHPNVNGAKKIAEYNFREVFNYFHVYD